MSPSAPDDNERLFHCANLQGVILGVGLAMLEQYFLQESQPSPDDLGKTKRRKTPANSTPGTPDIDDDDAVFPFHPLLPGHPGGHAGKKAKTGIGYAGSIREDVRVLLSYRVIIVGLE